MPSNPAHNSTGSHKCTYLDSMCIVENNPLIMSHIPRLKTTRWWPNIYDPQGVFVAKNSSAVREFPWRHYNKRCSAKLENVKLGKCENCNLFEKCWVSCNLIQRGVLKNRGQLFCILVFPWDVHFVAEKVLAFLSKSAMSAPTRGKSRPDKRHTDKTRVMESHLYTAVQ